MLTITPIDMLVIDAHLDLATNAIALNRNLQLPLHEIRRKEKELGWNDVQGRGNGTVSLPALREGKVGLVVATIISRFALQGNPLPTLALPGWHSPEQAYAYGQAQLGWYRVMEDMGEMVQIKNSEQLINHLALWNNSTIADEVKPVGYILSLEGADSIINLSYLEKYYADGLRAIGPAHFGPGRYAAGTHSDGSGLTASGRQLLMEMDRLGLILDTTHLTDKGFFEAMDLFKGKVWASHQNCRSLVKGERQFSDQQLKVLIERGGIVGGALDAWMLDSNFELGKSNSRELGINLKILINHFDHICQLAGNSNHVCFGTDLDGLFGTEQTPFDLDSIGDIQKYVPLLTEHGYSFDDIKKIFHENFLNFILSAWR